MGDARERWRSPRKGQAVLGFAASPSWCVASRNVKCTKMSVDELRKVRVIIHSGSSRISEAGDKAGSKERDAPHQDSWFSLIRRFTRNDSCPRGRRDAGRFAVSLKHTRRERERESLWSASER